MVKSGQKAKVSIAEGDLSVLISLRRKLISHEVFCVRYLDN